MVLPLSTLRAAAAGEKKILGDTSQPGGMWHQRRPPPLCCIVVEASQVLQTGPVAELVLVLEGWRGKKRYVRSEGWTVRSMIFIVTMTTALSINNVLFELNSVRFLLFFLVFPAKVEFVPLS